MSGKIIVLITILAVALTIGGLWGYGCYKGHIDDENDISYEEYKATIESMNPITRNGYKYSSNPLLGVKEEMENLKSELDKRKW